MRRMPDANQDSDERTGYRHQAARLDAESWNISSSVDTTLTLDETSKSPYSHISLMDSCAARIRLLQSIDLTCMVATKVFPFYLSFASLSYPISYTECFLLCFSCLTPCFPCLPVFLLVVFTLELSSCLCT